MDALETRAVWDIDDLEIRQDGRRISGSFRYGSTAIRSDRGRVRKERLGKRAFSYAIDGEGRTAELDLLVGHDFDKPMASRRTGTLEVKDGEDAMTFTAELPAPELQPTYMKDAILMLENRSFGGISPGFRVPPAGTVPNAEELIADPEVAGIFIRQINQAVLYEISLVTRASYKDTELSLRSEDLARRTVTDKEALYRWL